MGWLASMIWVAWAPASARPMIVTGEVSSSSIAASSWFITGQLTMARPSEASSASR